MLAAVWLAKPKPVLAQLKERGISLIRREGDDSDRFENIDEALGMFDLKGASESRIESELKEIGFHLAVPFSKGNVIMPHGFLQVRQALFVRRDPLLLFTGQEKIWIVVAPKWTRMYSNPNLK